MQIDNGKTAKNTHGYNFHFYPTTLAYINLPLSLARGKLICYYSNPIAEQQIY